LEEGLIVVAILSHGNEGFFSGTDGSKVQEATILKKFSVPELAEKPKLFIFVHCRHVCDNLRVKITNLL
jgi:hypothetical protein